MKYTTNIQKIQDLLVGRTALEQELALALSEVFHTGDLFRRINVAVWASCLFLEGLKSEPALKTTIENLERKNDFLFHTNPKTIEGVLAELDKGKSLTPEQCGNLIRFYGEVVEACASFSIYWRKQRAKQISWRYGGGGETFKASHDDNYVAQADQGTVWRKDKWLFSKTVTGTKHGPNGKEEKKDVLVPKLVRHWEQEPDNRGVLSWQKSILPAPDAGQGGRRRGPEKAKDAQGKPKDSYFAKAGEQKKPNPFYDIIPGNLFENENLKKLHIGKKFGGVMEWKMKDTSTVGIIDRVFGLPYGADISGTTSDELYFLTGWADASKGDPIVMMLPLAVIIGEYHHALLEVAAAMSLRRVISYSIGFYSTLLPPLPAGVAPQAQRGDITALLKRFEGDPRNQHVLLHYDKNNKIAGCFIAEGDDLAAFKKLGTVDIHLWPMFNSLPAYPPEDKIMGLLAEVGLGNAVLAARRGALRSPQESAEMEEKRLEKKLGFAA